MVEMNGLFGSGDSKNEKHVSVIDLPATAKKGEFLEVSASVGKEVAHPNKTEHHICWITLYFLPDGGKFPYQISKTEFNAHGASAQGPDTSTVYTHYQTRVSFKTDKPGVVLACSYCNIHGLWQNSQRLEIEA